MYRKGGSGVQEGWCWCTWRGWCWCTGGVVLVYMEGVVLVYRRGGDGCDIIGGQASSEEGGGSG